jgi:hypothetical protein
MAHGTDRPVATARGVPGSARPGCADALGSGAGVLPPPGRPLPPVVVPDEQHDSAQHPARTNAAPMAARERDLIAGITPLAQSYGRVKEPVPS